MSKETWDNCVIGYVMIMFAMMFYRCVMSDIHKTTPMFGVIFIQTIFWPLFPFAVFHAVYKLFTMRGYDGKYDY